MVVEALATWSAILGAVAWQADVPSSTILKPKPGAPVLYEWPSNTYPSGSESAGSVLVASLERCVGDKTEESYFATRRPSPYTVLTTAELCNGRVLRYRFSESYDDSKRRFTALGAYNAQGSSKLIPFNATRVQLRNSKQLEALAAASGLPPRAGRVSPQVVHLQCAGRARWGTATGIVARETTVALNIDLDRANYTATVISGVPLIANGKPLFKVGKSYPTSGIPGGGTQFDAERVSDDVSGGNWRGNVRLSPDGTFEMAEMYGTGTYVLGFEARSVVWLDGTCVPIRRPTR